MTERQFNDRCIAFIREKAAAMDKIITVKRNVGLFILFLALTIVSMYLLGPVWGWLGAIFSCPAGFFGMNALFLFLQQRME